MKKNPRLDDLPESDFLHGRKGPWPQPQPAHPLGEAPGVVHVPVSEWIDWWLHIGSRYVFTLPSFVIEYLRSALNPGLAEISDERLSELVSRSMISKFVTDQFDTKDREIFKDYDLTGKYLIDLEALRVVQAFKGMYTSGTKGLFTLQNDRYFPVAIWIDATQTLITPKDEGWELAKYYLLQGCAIAATLVIHPLLHFPLDSINAITKTALPTWHPIFRLLSPHLRFTLPLENAVLNFKSSLLQSKWWMPYAPYPGPAGCLRDLLVEGFKGIKFNVSYPPYKYFLKPLPVLSTYGEFQNAYFPAFVRFTEQMLQDVKSDDHLVTTWAKFISQNVPGFPGEAEITQGDTLIQAVASYLWQVSLGHTIDHYDYGNMDVREIPLRLRQAPPKKNDRVIDRKKLVTFWDSGKYRMARKLFFKNTTVTKLVDCQYDCVNERERAAVKEFQAELRRIDQEMKQKGICYIPLEEVAASIQF